MLLAVVVATAALSAFEVIETDPRMTLPATWPGVWLPAWLVQLALVGHLLVFRALRRDGLEGGSRLEVDSRRRDRPVYHTLRGTDRQL